MEKLTILRFIFSLIFALINIYFSNFIKAIENKKKCELSKGWKITNGKIISSLLIIVGFINAIIPANKWCSNIPFIGSTYMIIFILALFMNIYIINRLSINVKDNETYKCNIKGYDMLINSFTKIGFVECIYITIAISILFFCI
jgi:hypothetical protein